MNYFSSDLLQNKVAIVTGAGKGIGYQIALSLCASGATVIANARTESDLNKLASDCESAALSGRIEPLVADVSDKEFIEKIEGMTVDILVNNVGTNRPAPFIDVSEADYDHAIDLNMRSVFFITQQVVRSMIKNEIAGSIVNISSQMGHIGSPNRSVYCATKHAVEGLTKALSVELAPNGIRVNSVAPTFVKTPLTEPMLEDEEFKDFVMSNIPLKQLATPSDVAHAVVYLASNLSRSVTGTSLKVDGGWTAQ